jgi:hypothetical protein
MYTSALLVYAWKKRNSSLFWGVGKGPKVTKVILKSVERSDGSTTCFS